MKIRLGYMLRNLIAGANIVTIMLMIITGFAFIVDPAEHPTFATLSFFFPAALAVNIAFAVFWAFVHRIYIIIPAIGLIVCYIPVRTYCPINISNDDTEGCVKILSFNTMYFTGLPGEELNKADNDAVSYIIDSKADIVCLQEGNISSLTTDEQKRLKEAFPHYTNSMTKYSLELPIFTRYPILSADTIAYVSQGNHSIAYTLADGSDTIIVINNHLESNRFTKEEKDQFSQLVHGQKEREEARAESHLVIQKLAEKGKLRAPQADAVAEFIRQHSGMSIIVCGDFNDNPNSYTRHTIAEDLYDCFIKTGNGMGWSYARNGMRVRIDNILCSKNFKPVKCFVDTKVTLSDHFPIVSYIKKQQNEEKMHK